MPTGGTARGYGGGYGGAYHGAYAGRPGYGGAYRGSVGGYRGGYGGYRGGYGGYHGYSTGAYWHGGYWHGGFWPRAYYGLGYAWFLPILPLAYATYWYGGIPYYYANDVYYTWSPTYDGYVATDPPHPSRTPAARRRAFAASRCRPAGRFRGRCRPASHGGRRCAAARCVRSGGPAGRSDLHVPEERAEPAAASNRQARV